MTPSIPTTPKGEKARELFVAGYNCSQSVAEEIGLPLDTVLKLAQPFGGGMGRMREVCGTFSGALFVIGQLYGDTDPKSDNKARVYTIVQELAAEFRAAHGSLICREILGFMKNQETDPAHPSERNEEFYKKRPCAEYVGMCARITEEIIMEKGKN